MTDTEFNEWLKEFAQRIAEEIDCPLATATMLIREMMKRTDEYRYISIINRKEAL